jgi:LL-diaminopimelate aminotransferase
MIQPAQRLQHIEEYIFSQIRREMKAVEKRTGRKVLDFGQGNPDFPPSQKAITQLQKYIAENDAHLYPGYGAIPLFSEALQKWYKKRFNVVIESDELLPLLGAKDGIAHLPVALFNEGDEVLVPNPGYPPYHDPLKLVGAKPVLYNLLEKDDFNLSLSEIEKKLTKKTKAIWVNFPSNPTGRVITLPELKELVAFAKKHKIIILYDNAYSEITFDGYIAPSILEIKGAKDVAIEFNSFSKAFSFAGFRMGWVVGNKELIALLAKVKTQMDSGLTVPLQKLGAYILTDEDKAWKNDMIKTYKKRRDIVAKHLTKLGMTFVLPKGSMYIWAKIPPNVENSEVFCDKLLQEKQIVFIPGTAFGSNGKGYVRVSIGIKLDDIKDYF